MSGDAGGTRYEAAGHQRLARACTRASCHAWPLPADATCATVARQVFRDAVSEVGLEPDLLDDCVLMASELAANTLHARAVAGTGGGGIGSCPSPRTWEANRFHPPPGPARPAHPAGTARSRRGPAQSRGLPRKLWLYLRGLGTRRELVCKVFDCYRGWRHGSAPSTVPGPLCPGRDRARPADRAGAVLRPVGAPSHPGQARRLGRCAARPSGSRCPRRWPTPGWWTSPGCARTRSRPTSPPPRASERLSARQAARELEAMLDERGFGGRLVRADQPPRTCRCCPSAAA